MLREFSLVLGGMTLGGVMMAGLRVLKGDNVNWCEGTVVWVLAFLVCYGIDQVPILGG